VKLVRAINSIVNTAGNKANYEICLRVHSDDAMTLAMIPEILHLGNVRIHIGPPLDWAHNYQAFNEAQQISRGTWAWLFNDDCVMEGSNWDAQLINAPIGIAIPEIHRLGKSTYHHDRAIPMFAMPNVRVDGEWMPRDGDNGLWNRYKDFTPHWLTGITVWHDRAEDDCHKINEGL
jgi:hypothetical protein